MFQNILIKKLSISYYSTQIIKLLNSTFQIMRASSSIYEFGDESKNKPKNGRVH